MKKRFVVRAEKSTKNWKMISYFVNFTFSYTYNLHFLNIKWKTAHALRAEYANTFLCFDQTKENFFRKENIFGKAKKQKIS